MKTLFYLWYNTGNKPAFIKAVMKELLCSMLYSVFGFFFHHCLDLPPVGWWTFNIIYIYWMYCKYTTPDDWVYWGSEWLSDTLTTTLFQFVAYYMYPYLEQYPFLWWILHIIYLYLMEDLF